MNINEHLATKVMRWTRGETEFQHNDENGHRVLDGTLFDPLNNIEQAMMCLDVIKRTYIVWINIEDDYNGVAVHERMMDKILAATNDKHLSKAISTAIAMATGWEE